MSLLHRPQVSSWARGHLLCRVDGPLGGRFALTFDDGPSEEWTPPVLDRLAERGARATFFMLAGPMQRRPDLVRRVLAEGHEVALHGRRHWPLPLVSEPILRDEIAAAERALAGAAGARARFYRPPFGFMTPGQARRVRELGYESVLGDVYPEDPHRPGIDRIVRRVLQRITEGSIVILHDGAPLGRPDRSQTLAALPTILEQSAARGLHAVTVAELIEAAGTPEARAAEGS